MYLITYVYIYIHTHFEIYEMDMMGGTLSPNLALGNPQTKFCGIYEIPNLKKVRVSKGWENHRNFQDIMEYSWNIVGKPS